MKNLSRTGITSHPMHERRKNNPMHVNKCRTGPQCREFCHLVFSQKPITCLSPAVVLTTNSSTPLYGKAHIDKVAIYVATSIPEAIYSALH